MVEKESRDICIMKVGFISEFDVDNKKAWSGTINFLYETLSKEYELYPMVVKPTFAQKCFKKITKIRVASKTRL